MKTISIKKLNFIFFHLDRVAAVYMGMAPGGIQDKAHSNWARCRAVHAKRGQQNLRLHRGSERVVVGTMMERRNTENEVLILLYLSFNNSNPPILEQRAQRK